MNNQKVLTGTVMEALRDIVDNLTQADRNALIDTKFDDLIKFHNGFGTYIRNNYGLQKETKLREDMLALCETLGIEAHPDSCSHILIEQMWCRVILDNVDLANDDKIKDANMELLK